MFEDQVIVLDGVTYGWICYETGSPRDCWNWVNAVTYTKPGAAIVGRLNKQFIAERAGDVAATLDCPGRERVADILDAMGASRETLLAVFGTNVDLLPARLRHEQELPLPPATHMPFNNPESFSIRR